MSKITELFIYVPFLEKDLNKKYTQKDIKTLQSDLKYNFDVDYKEAELGMYFEPTLEEEIIDTELLYSLVQ